MRSRKDVNDVGYRTASAFLSAQRNTTPLQQFSQSKGRLVRNNLNQLYFFLKKKRENRFGQLCIKLKSKYNCI